MYDDFNFGMWIIPVALSVAALVVTIYTVVN